MQRIILLQHVREEQETQKNTTLQVLMSPQTDFMKQINPLKPSGFFTYQQGLT